MSSPTLFKQASKGSFAPFLVVVALALFVAVGALPRYMGDWPWANNPTVPNKSALVAIKEDGMALPGWQMQEQLTTKIGGKTWSIQQFAAELETKQSLAPKSPSEIVLLLRSQVWYADQPEVEWVDIQGAQKWKTDEHRTLSFAASREGKAQTIQVRSDFFRARNPSQTYAVLQWYAWPTGGSPSPAKWFWTDQIAQWKHSQRTPWVAVSLWLPIEPFSDISVHQVMAKSLGKTVQTMLLDTVFPKPKPS